MKRYYLAYGSNLNLLQMKYRCKGAVPVGTTILNNYRLVFKGSGDSYAYLTIEPYEGSYVPLGIFEISFFNELSLDKYEGYPRAYRKEYKIVNISGKEVQALIYVMNEGFDYNIPSIDYLLTCVQGYNDFGFNPDILDNALRETVRKIRKTRKR